MSLRRILLVVATTGLMGLASSPGMAAEIVGEAGIVTGRVTAASEAGEIRSLDRGAPIYEGEMVNTGPSSYVNMKFTDGGRVLLRPNSRFQIERFESPGDEEPERRKSRSPRTEPAPSEEREEEEEEDQEEEEEDGGSAFFNLVKGGFRAVTGLVGREDRESYKVRTPVATIGIRGTDYEVRYCAGDCQDVDPVPRDGLYAGVNEGGISLTNEAGEHVTAAGRFAFVSDAASTPVALRNRPRPLAQDPIPDPEACD